MFYKYKLEKIKIFIWNSYFVCLYLGKRVNILVKMFIKSIFLYLKKKICFVWICKKIEYIKIKYYLIFSLSCCL